MPAPVCQTDIVLRHEDKELVRITLPPGQYTIGRNPDVQIYVNTPLLSRRHARLTIDAQHLLIEDLGSSNGTFIDNQPVTKVTRLLPNQSLRLGDVRLDVRRRGPVEASPTPPKPHPNTPPAKPSAKAPAKSAPPPPQKPARKSSAPLYGGILVVLMALGAVGFVMWPKPVKLTQAELYAKDHPKEASSSTSTPAPQSSAKIDAQIGELKSALLAANLQNLKDNAVTVSPSGKISVDLRGSTISDLSILSGYSVDELQLSGTRVNSLDPLRSLPLVTLHFNGTGVTDASPVAGIATLENVLLGKSLTNLESLRTAPHIRWLSYDSVQQGEQIFPTQTAEEFWKMQDEQKEKRAPVAAILQKMGVKSVTEQKLSINKAGKFEINLSGLPISDLTPLAGLAIARLDVSSTKVSDLTPLQGMALQYLNICACPVADLSPLHGQPIVDLLIGVKDWKKPNQGMTKVTDLSPVRGMPLHKISIDGTVNPDVAPLAECPSVQIVVLPANARHVEALRKLPNLKKICQGWPGTDDKVTVAAAFWKDFDANKGTSPQVAAAAPNAPAEDLGADEKVFGEAKKKRLELLAKFQFAEAHDAILAPALQTEPARDEQETLGKKAQWLATFKSQLIEDLNKGGYAQPVASKSGAALPGGIAQADQRQLVLRTARGAIPVPWTEISPDSLIAMSTSFIDPNMPKEIAAFRKWQLGVFASFAGKNQEGLVLLKEAADLKPVYRDELTIFERPSSSW